MPRNQNSIFLVIAVIVGMGAFVLTTKLVKPTTPVEPPPVYVVSLAKDLEKGSTIGKEDLNMVAAPKNVDPSVLFTKSEEVVGKITNRPLPKDSLVRNIDLIAQGDNLANLIPEGYQAVTIPVSLPANLTNLIKVGNRVDVLITYERKGGDFKSIPLMKNVKVIGVSSPESGSGGNLQVTIAVPPEGAKTLAYAVKRGVLNVAVRSLAEKDQNQPEKIFTLEELSKAQLLDDAVKTTNIPLMEEIEVIRGLNKETYRFVNGKAEKANTGDKKA